MTYPVSRAYRARVARVQRLSPSFTRLTFAGDETQHLALMGPDQRIKLLLPFADGRVTDFGLFDEPRPSMTEWYRRWRELPDADRNQLRTYTVRAVRPEAGEVDIDFVLHGTEGPASAWADAAKSGDELIIIGPDRRADLSQYGGVEWHPGRAERVLLAGDETAAPAICAIVEGLAPGVSGRALIEVPTGADEIPIANRSGVEVQWLPRDGADVGTLLAAAVTEWGADRAARRGEAPEEPSVDDILWEIPDEVDGEEYAWLAGEAGVITALRRHLVRDLGIDRRTVAFMGYWRAGRSEGS